MSGRLLLAGRSSAGRQDPKDFSADTMSNLAVTSAVAEVRRWPTGKEIGLAQELRRANLSPPGGGDYKLSTFSGFSPNSRPAAFSETEESMIAHQLRIIEEKLRSELLSLKLGVSNPTRNLGSSSLVSGSFCPTCGQKVHGGQPASPSYSNFSREPASPKPGMEVRYGYPATNIWSPEKVSETTLSPDSLAAGNQVLKAENSAAEPAPVQANVDPPPAVVESSPTSNVSVPQPDVSQPEVQLAEVKPSIEEKLGLPLANKLRTAFRNKAGIPDELEKALLKYDRDGSGELSVDELKKFVRIQLRIGPGEISAADMASFVDALDEKKSSQLSIRQIQDFLNAGEPQAEKPQQSLTTPS